MPYRVRSTDLWYNMPGIVAAYQPLSAPDPISARVNVGNNRATAGRNRAALGVAPTWSPLIGWTFDGTKRLLTGVVPTLSYTIICRFSGVSGSNRYIFAATNAAVSAAFLINQGNNNQRMWWSGSTIYRNGAQAAAGVQALAGLNAYMDGAYLSTLASAGSAPDRQLVLGGYEPTGTGGAMVGNIQAAAIYNRTLSASEVWQATLQMRYVERNPDWSAWSRRRQYWVLPAQAATSARWPVVGNGVIGGGRIVRSVR